MQYQKILLLLNMTVLAMVYFFCKDKPKMFKLFVSTTLYAYILAIPIPYLLLWIPLKWIVLFYMAAVGLSLIIIDTILSNFEDIKLEKAAANSDSQYQQEDESAGGSTQDLNKNLLSVGGTVRADIKDQIMEDDAKSGPIEAMAAMEEEKEAVISEPDTAQSETAAVIEVNESSNDELMDIDELIDEAFNAKFKDDYISAINIFEQILKRRPPEEIIQLITEDIEVMLKKIS